jgi:hypothetical protein
MDLAKLQTQINNAKNTTQTLQTVDAMALPVGTVLKHKRSGYVGTIQSNYDSYIDGLIYIVIDNYGNEWLAHGYNINELFYIVHQPTQTK